MTLIYILTLLAIGFLSSYIFSREIKIFERVSISIGLGILMTSLGFFTILSFGYGLNLHNVLFILLLLIIGLGMIVIFNKDIRKLLKNDFILISKINTINLKRVFKDERKYLSVTMIILTIIVFMITILWPISEWDALTLYDFRGRLYAEGLNFADIQNIDNYDLYNVGYYFSYPPSTSLIHASFYVLGSNLPQIVYPVIFLSFILFFFVTISKHINFDAAYIVSGLLMMTNIFVSHASVPYTNLPFTYFYFVSSILLIEYLFDRKNSKLFLSALFLAGSSWMRSVEPFYIINILILLIFDLFKDRKYLSFIKFVIPVFLLRKSWSLIQSKYTVSSFLTGFDFKNILGNLFVSIPVVITKALTSFVGFIVSNSMIFLLLLVSTIILIFKFKSKNTYFEKILGLLIYLNLGVIMSGTLVIGILLPGRSEIYDSINRFGIFLYPFILYLAGLMFKDVKFTNRTND